MMIPEVQYREDPQARSAEIESIRRIYNIPTEKLLWQALDEGRRPYHIQARKNPFLQKLTIGGFCQTEFMKYLVNLLPIHQALEEAQQKLLQIEHLKGFVNLKLFRSEAIKKDLEIWESIASKEFVPWKPSQISLDFALYIRGLEPDRVVAVMYTLYGTIMSGGQTNKSIVEKALEGHRSYMDDIPEGSGVALYQLEEDVTILKMKWHQKLCEIGTLLPKDTSIEAFHGKLQAEVGNTFKILLEIIEKDVQTGHC